MAILDRATWQQKFSDFINRVPPFTDPLIQKSEHEEVVGTDLADSVIYSIATESNINAPSSSFSVDFATSDQFNIDTTSVGTTAFTITLQNLLGNNTGILNITKKTNDTFSFANGTMVPIDSTAHQSGLTRLFYYVKNVNGTYVLLTGVESATTLPVQSAIIPIGGWNMDGDLTTTVPHSIPSALTSIVAVRASIIRDDNSYASDLFTSGGTLQTSAPVLSGKITWTNSNFLLTRGSGFDNGNYNNAGINRGNILAYYV